MIVPGADDRCDCGEPVISDRLRKAGAFRNLRAWSTVVEFSRTLPVVDLEDSDTCRQLS